MELGWEPEKKVESEHERMKGGLGWIRRLKWHEQDMSSLALEWEPFF